MVRTLGFAYAFHATPWEDIRSLLANMAEQDPQFAHMLAVVQSVIDSSARARLAGLTSMHDVLVTTTPVSQPPVDVIAVRAPGSIREPAPGMVRIEHLSVTGRNDSVDRPVDETVPLFWRFTLEKLGVVSR